LCKTRKSRPLPKKKYPQNKQKLKTYNPKLGMIAHQFFYSVNSNYK
jgi:hypothetical protein